MSYSVFDTTKTKSHLEKTVFLDEPVSIARYDKVKYPVFEKLTDQQLGYFWRPQEIELVKDKKDFNSLTDREQHIFTSNLKRQILLDSVQGRALSISLGWVTSLPEVEVWFKTQEFFETIHNRSYTHILRHIYANPSVVLDSILDIQEIADCAKSISEEYDKLIGMNIFLNSQSFKGGFMSKETRESSNKTWYFEHKRQIWRTLNALAALEGIRFYVSFVCSWAFAEQKKMEGNAKIIKLICRDENLHLAGAQNLLKILPKEDSDFAVIKQVDESYIIDMVKKVINQEKTWAKFLCKDGAMLGLNEEILYQTVDYFGYKRAVGAGLPASQFENVSNPIPWANKWISGSDVQARPQEETLTQYVVGGVVNDATSGSFSKWKL